MKALKVIGIILIVLFSFFFFLGFILYVVYYVYTNHKKEVNNLLQKYPQISRALRKTAAFTSEVVKDDKLSRFRSAAASVKPEKLKVKAASSNKRSSAKSTLNSRQNKIVELLGGNVKLEMSQIKSNFPNINVRTVRRDLSKLESLGIITKSGKTKGSFYKLQ